ncbi:MAG: hypothetical protein LBC75_00650 [Fibromonadaceae bacterium]|jgi:hypothetical protein|nr:hypothetical protein [Fibromonadaceae bacterium]
MSDTSNSWDLAFKRALAMPPADATYLARLIPKAKPVPYPPPKPFEMPNWSGKVILTPWVWQFAKENIKPALQSAFDRIDNLKMGLEYMNPINYEGLANEAANRHISNQKR